MGNQKPKPKTILGLLALAVILVLVFWFAVRKPEANGALDAFAQCLASKGATMYGAASCPFCQEEKGAFGNSFHWVPYVECPKEPKRCLEAGIRMFPSWIFADGRKLEGRQGLEKLSQQSGCPLSQ